MTDTSVPAVLLDAFDRVHQDLPRLLNGLDGEALTWRVDAAANSIGWLAWHLARVQDDHLADIGGREQVWTADGFRERFGLPYPTKAIGYGQTSQDVGMFDVRNSRLLIDYHDAVHVMTVALIEGMGPGDFDRIVDTRWDPPVTAAARLVSVVNDTSQHVGQIGYLRGLWERR